MICITCWLWTILSPDWLTAIGTIGTVMVAMLLALYGQPIGELFFHPELNLDAKVQRPDADKVRRRAQSAGGQTTDLGEYYYFRLAVTNTGKTAAKDVQVFLSKVERLNGDQFEIVNRFTPMNLKWTNTKQLPAKDRVTRPVLLADMPPVYCDLAHVGEPQRRANSGEDLPNVPAGKAVLGLDVELPTYSKGHVLEPGVYRFSLTLAASNRRPTYYVMEVSFLGEWLPDMEKMFKTGFKMGKPKPCRGEAPMNLREGMRRTGIVLGAVGCVAGGVFGYWNLQKVWYSHTAFERLQSGPVILGIARAAKDCASSAKPTKVAPGEVPIPPGAVIGPWEKYKPPPGAVLEHEWKLVESPDSYKGVAVAYYDTIAQLCPSVADFIPDQFHVKARKSDWFDRNAPGANDPDMEFTIDVKEETTEGLKTVNLDKGGAVSSIELKTGEWVRRQPRGIRGDLAFIAGLLLSLCFPVIGFLIPWGTIRVLVWVASGFSAASSQGGITH